MYVRINDVDVYYEIFGKGEPLLFIHGFGIDSSVMKKGFEPVWKNGLVANLSVAGEAPPKWQEFMRIYFDLPGMGNTKETTGIIKADDMLNVILGFIEKVIPNRSFSVVGYSYGGYLARGLLKRQFEMVKGLFLLCPVIYPHKEDRNLPPFEVIERESWVNGALSTEEVTEPKAFKKFLGSFVVQNEYTWKRYLDEIYPGLIRVDKEFLKRFQSEGYAFSFEVDGLDKPFNGPVAVLTGRQDSVVGYVDSFKLIDNYPRGSFVVLDGAGHNLQIEKEGIFKTLFLDWLMRLSG